MSTLLPRPRPTAPEWPAGLGVGTLTAAVAAVRAALLGLLTVLVLVLVAWAGAADSGAGAGEATRAAAHAWLLAHHAAFETSGGTLALAPLGWLLLPAALLFSAGARAGRARPVDSLGPAARSVAALATTYAILAAVVAGLAPTGAVRPLPGTAFLAAGVLALVAGGAGLLRACDLTGLLLATVPARVLRSVRAATAGVAVLVGGGALLAAGALGWQAERATALTRALDGGALGGVLVNVLGLGLAANLAVWAAAYAVGPGFAVGLGTSVTPAGVTLGDLPALPVLAGLPTTGSGSAPGWLGWLVLVIPVAAGVSCGLVVARTDLDRAGGPASPLALAGEAAVAGAVSGLLLAALAAASGGPVTDGRLVAVGPSPWQVGLAAAAELAVVAALTAEVVRRRRA